jgi:hypothetical protein
LITALLGTLFAVPTFVIVPVTVQEVIECPLTKPLLVPVVSAVALLEVNSVPSYALEALEAVILIGLAAIVALTYPLTVL